MKANIFRYATLLMLLPALFGCKQEMEFGNGSPVPVTVFNTPANGADFALIDTPSASTAFSWDAVSSGSVKPIYSVAFYASQTGNEIYRIQADGSGMRNVASVLHTTINDVATIAGIVENQEGDLWWSVVTTTGQNEKLADHPRWKITVKRLNKFSIPENLYITGSATEGGENGEDAKKFRNEGNGVFVIYTRLTGGEGDTFLLTNNPVNGNSRILYGMVDGTLAVGDHPVVLAAGEANTGNDAYRVTVDFVKGTILKERISDVKYHYPSNDPQTQPMEYIGGGVWKITGKAISFTASWGSEDLRYKFRATVDGVEKTWGRSGQDDNTRPLNLDDVNYFRIYEKNLTSDNWHYSYRGLPAMSGLTVDIYLDMSRAEFPVHRFDVGDVTAYPVASLDTPADNELIRLATVGVTNAEFTWTPNASAGNSSSYFVEFYSDAQGTQLVSRREADNGGAAAKLTISHADLETIAKNAGVADEAEGIVYWSVVTETFSGEVKPEFAPAAVRIQRLAGIPTELYITGSASEYTDEIADAGKLRNTAPGEFEIHTKLSAGTYYFTDKTDGTGRMFTVTGSAISETTAASTVTDEKIYRIRLNFNNNTAVYDEITKLVYHFCPRTTDNRELTYTGKGVWRMTDYYLEFKDEGSWRDQRYHFQAFIPGRPTYEKEIWGATASEDSAPSSLTDTNYFKIYITPYIGDMWWNNKYKFHSSLDYQTIGIDVIMSPDVDFYYHKTYKM